MFERMRIAALVHDLGKAFSRKRHEDVTVKILKEVLPLEYATLNCLG